MRSDCAEGRAGYWCLKGNQAEYAAKNVSLTHKKKPRQAGHESNFYASTCLAGLSPTPR